MKDVSKQKGFVILMATLLSGLFLMIGASIFSISLKELRLSSGGKESQAAFYAADSGIECAVFWDTQYSIFATSTHSGSAPDNIFCNDQDITDSDYWQWKIPPTTNTKAQTSFSFDFDPEPYCVNVIVFKDSGDTTIEARGYNTCDESNPRRVERGVRVTY